MTTSYRCADESDGRDEPLFATGSRVRGWLLVEVRGAWGEDAIHSSAFGAHVPRTWKNALKQAQIRVVCIRSHLRSETPGVRLFVCAVRRPGRGPAQLWRRDVDSLADVVPAVAGLTIDQVPPDGWDREPERQYLVCTNGRHDQCCANRGRPLVRALYESRWADRVWECSHVGGDRFAANVVAIPDSLYFGRVDPDSAPALLSGLDDGRIDLTTFRGRTAFSLPEQAVEHFVRRELGIDTLDGIVVERRREGDAFRVVAGERTLRVSVKRHMVSVDEPITCKGTPGQLVPAFTLESITD